MNEIDDRRRLILRKKQMKKNVFFADGVSFQSALFFHCRIRKKDAVEEQGTFLVGREEVARIRWSRNPRGRSKRKKIEHGGDGQSRALLSEGSELCTADDISQGGQGEKSGGEGRERSKFLFRALVPPHLEFIRGPLFSPFIQKTPSPLLLPVLFASYLLRATV